MRPSLKKKIYTSLGRYFLGQLLLILVNTFAFFFILNFLKVRGALFLAVLTGVLSVIPTVGMLTAALITFLVSVVDGQSHFLFHPLIEGLIILIVYFIYNEIVDLILSPIIIGKAVRISPIVIFLSLIIAASVFGLWGALLAVPFLIIIKTILEDRK